MNLHHEIGLTFDDVLLVPRRSSIRSRSAVDTSRWLVPGIRMAIPIISANMDTVTEVPMAIAMAQAGGIGISHRFMPIQRQAEAVRRVKRSESFIVENPITIPPNVSLAEARRKMVEADIGGLVVADEAGHLLGMLTNRDILLAPEGDLLVQDVMTLVCVGPADKPAGVVIRTFADQRVVFEETIAADGRRHPPRDSSCEGWQLVEWSSTGRRVFTTAESTCKDQRIVRISGFTTITSDDR